MQQTQNPFEMLGISPRYELSASELKEIEKIYREKSREVHPDRVSRGSHDESENRLDFASRSAALNEAFRVVKDPVKRAEAMFAILGVKTGDGIEPKPSPDFLMTMLDQREALAEARAARDLDRVHALAKDLKKEEDGVHRVLAEAFASKNIDERAMRALGELRFYVRFREEVRAIEDEMDSHEDDANERDANEGEG